MIVRAVTRCAGIGGGGLCQSLFFELHVRLQVNGGGFHRFVAEPEGYYGTVDTVVEEIHRQRVSEYVRRHVLSDQ